MATIRWDGPLDKRIRFTSNDSEIEQDYLGKDLNKYHDLVPVSKYHYAVVGRGHKMTISPIMDDFIETPIVKMIKEEVMKNMTTWGLGDKVIYVGDNIPAHNRHGVITAVYTKVK